MAAPVAVNPVSGANSEVVDIEASTRKLGGVVEPMTKTRAERAAALEAGAEAGRFGGA